MRTLSVPLLVSQRNGDTYLAVKVALGAVLAQDERLRLVDLAAGVGELADFDLVRVALSGSDVSAERRVRDVVLVELDADAVLTCNEKETILIQSFSDH